MDYNQYLAYQLGIPQARSKQDKEEIIAFSNPPSSVFNDNKEYVKKARNAFQQMQKERTDIFTSIQKASIKDPFKYNDRQIYRYIESSFNSKSQISIDALKYLTSNLDDTSIAFDIETMGYTDAEEPGRFAVTEIAANEYDSNGKFIGTGFTQMIRPDEKVLSNLNDWVSLLKQDPTNINALDGTQRRAVLDLMRYSTYDDGVNQPFGADEEGERHNTVVESELTKDEKLNHYKFFNDPQRYIQHMESGIQNLSSDSRLTQKEAAQKINEFINEQNKKGKVFTSFNGETFDIPVLERFMKNNGVEMVRPDKSFDLLAAIRTVYRDPQKAMDALIEGAQLAHEEKMDLWSKIPETDEKAKQEFAQKYFNTKDYDSIQPLVESDIENVKADYETYKKVSPIELFVENESDDIRDAEIKRVRNFIFEIPDQQILQTSDKDLMNIADHLTSSISHHEGEFIKAQNSFYNNLKARKKQALKEHQDAAPRMRSWQLQAFGNAVEDEMKAMYGGKDLAHNANADTNLTAHVASLLQRQMIHDVEDGNRNETPFKMKKNDPRVLGEGQYRMDDSPIHIGDEVIVQKAYRVFDDDDLSYKAIYDDKTGEYDIHPYGNNKLVTEGQGSMYIFQGIREHEIDGEKYLGLHLYQPDTNDHSFILRKGNGALTELTDVFHSHFIGYTRDSEKLAVTRRASEEDNARRAYDRLFSTSSGGAEKVAEGYSAAKRMYQAADIYDKYKEDAPGKRKQRAEALVASGEAKDLDSAYRMLGWHFDSNGDKAKEMMLQQITDLFRKTDGTVHEKQLLNFWKLQGKLRDELPYYQQFFNAVEKHFEAEESNALLTKDESRLRKIRTQKEIALFNFHQSAKAGGESMVEVPLKTDKPMREIEVIDRRFNQARTMNLSDARSTQQAINRFMSAGVNPNSERKDQLKRERLVEMLNNMAEQGVIGKRTQESLIEKVLTIDKPWNASHAIAEDLIKNANVTLRDSQETTNIHANTVIQDTFADNVELNNAINKSIYRATNSRLDYQYHPELKRSEITLPKAMQQELNVIENSVASNVIPHNTEAIKDVIDGIKATNPKKTVGLKFNKDGNPSVDFYVYDPEHGGQIQDALYRGEEPSKAIHFNMPLISAQGTIRTGEVIANADMVARYNEMKKNVEVISTVEQLAKDVRYKVQKALEIAEENGIDSASKYMRGAIRHSLEEQSGINRNTSKFEMNDTTAYRGNTDDFLKQNRIRIENAMIQDFYHNGFGEGDNRFKLTDSDFLESAYYDRDGVKTLKKNLTMENLNPTAALKLKEKHLQWAQARIRPDLFANSVKSTKSGLMVSALDIRDMQALGNLYEHKRDNLIQMQNLHNMNDDVREQINGVKGSSTHLNFVSDMQNQLELITGEIPNLAEGNFAIMTNEQLQRRLNQMMKNPKERKILEEEGLVTTNGELDALKMPTTYEQQGVLANELKDNMNYTQTKSFRGRFNLAEGITNQSELKPGTIFAYETLENGDIKPVQYTGTNIGRISNVDLDDGQIDIEWKENAFKYMMNGEKMTARGYSQRLLESITGMNGIVGIYDSNVAKHGDFGQLAAGKISLMVDAINQVKGPEEQNKYIQIMENEGLGVKWNPNKQQFVDETNKDGFFKTGDSLKSYVDKIYSVRDKLQGAGLKIEWGNTLEEGNHIEKYRMQFGMAGVADYSKTIDYTGQKVLRTLQPDTDEYKKHLLDEYKIDVDQLSDEEKGKLKPINIYQKERKGVTVGHREMRVLDSLGMTATHDYLFKEMLAQTTGLDTYGKLMNMSNDERGKIYSGLEEDLKEHLEFNPSTFQDEFTKHMSNKNRERNAIDDAVSQYKQLQSITGEYQPVQGEYIYRHDDFKPAPVNTQDKHMYNGTFLDMESITEKTGNKHGFWLELPKMINADGKETKVKVNTIDGEKELDRIFMPFTTESKLNGQQFLDNIQQVNKQILDAAARVDRATGDDKEKAMTRLQQVINEQSLMSVKNLTSSKGLVGENILSAKMKQSTSGLYKLVDGVRAEQVRKQHGMDEKTEFSAISENTAKKMGIYEKLTKGEVIYGAHIRYPTFHEGAIQFNRIIMDSSLADNEIHTSDISAMLKRADSDGDWGYMFTVNNNKVQAEWRKYDDTRQEFFADQIKKFNSEIEDRRNYVNDLKGEQGKVLRDMLSDDSYRVLMNGNAEEIAAKIGKVTVGQASNLNYFMQQVGAEQFADNPEMRKKIAQFGEGIEQKIISSKHGGKPIGLEMINAIKNGNWNKALQIDQDYFTEDNGKGMFANKYNMEEVAEVMPTATEKYVDGLRSKGLRIGTSSGLSEMPVEEAMQFIQGNPEVGNQQTATNKFAQMMRTILGIPQFEKDIRGPKPSVEEFQNRLYEGETSVDAPTNNSVITDSAEESAQSRIPKKPIFERMKEKIPSQASETFNNVRKSGKIKTLGITAGLLGIGAMAGSFISQDNTPEAQPYAKSESNRAPRRQADENNTQGATIHISGKGQKGSSSTVSSAVQQGIYNTNMNSNQTNINVTTTDNTTKLNRVWYRDKVQENYQ